MGFGALLQAFSDRTRGYREEASRAQQGDELGLFRTLSALTGPEVDPSVRQQAMHAMLEVGAGRARLTRRDMSGYFGATQPPPHVQGLLDLIDQMGGAGGAAGASQTGAPPPAATETPESGYVQPAVAQTEALTLGQPMRGLPPPMPTTPGTPSGTMPGGAGTGAAPVAGGTPTSLWRDPASMLRDEITSKYTTYESLARAHGSSPEAARTYAMHMTAQPGQLPQEPSEQWQRFNYLPVGVALTEQTAGQVRSGRISARTGEMVDDTGQPLGDVWEVPPAMLAQVGRTSPEQVDVAPNEEYPAGSGQYRRVARDKGTGKELWAGGKTRPPVEPPDFSGYYTDQNGVLRRLPRVGGAAEGGPPANVTTSDMRLAKQVQTEFNEKKRLGGVLYSMALSEDALKRTYDAKGKPRPAGMESREQMDARFWREVTKGRFPSGTTPADIDQVAAGILDRTLKPRTGATGASTAGTPPPTSGTPLVVDPARILQRMQQNSQPRPASAPPPGG